MYMYYVEIRLFSNMVLFVTTDDFIIVNINLLYMKYNTLLEQFMYLSILSIIFWFSWAQKRSRWHNYAVKNHEEA